MRGHDAKHLSDINGSKRLRFDDPFVVCVTDKQLEKHSVTLTIFVYTRCLKYSCF